MRTLLPMLAFALFATACSTPVSRDAFPQKAAKILCKKAAACDKADFDATYDSISECTDDVDGVVEGGLDTAETIDIFDVCEWDDAAAGALLADLRAADCNEDSIDWGSVYVCNE